MCKLHNPTISIIVPVYNTSSYLEKCLDSIYNQTFKDYQLICVDDGSSDNSLQILKKYQNKIKNLKIISQKNQGVAAARNTALSHATGDYIIFIDSDDYIKENYLEVLYNESCKNNSDVVICNFYRYFEKIDKEIPVYIKKKRGQYTKEEILNSLIPDILIHSYLWNKLWKKDLFNNIQFPKIKYEDISIMCYLFDKSKKISIIDDTLYYYRIRKTSIVRNYSIDTQNDYVKAYGLIRLYIHENNLYEKYKKAFNLLSIKVFLVMFFINIFLMNDYNNKKITITNFKRIYNFISKCNSDKFDYTKKDLLQFNILKSTD